MPRFKHSDRTVEFTPYMHLRPINPEVELSLQRLTSALYVPRVAGDLHFPCGMQREQRGERTGWGVCFFFSLLLPGAEDKLTHSGTVLQVLGDLPGFFSRQPSGGGGAPHPDLH